MRRLDNVIFKAKCLNMCILKISGLNEAKFLVLVKHKCNILSKIILNKYANLKKITIRQDCKCKNVSEFSDIIRNSVNASCCLFFFFLKNKYYIYSYLVLQEKILKKQYCC